MYGVEAQSSGGGGLAAQAPSDLYFGAALGIQNQASAVTGTPPTTGVNLPFSAAGEIQTPTAFGSSGPGMEPTTPVSRQQPHWSSVFDFHNSVAPWILLGILVLYGWLHASVRAKAGPASVAAVL